MLYIILKKAHFFLKHKTFNPAEAVIGSGRDHVTDRRLALQRSASASVR